MIETARLVVRPWRAADRAPYLAYCNTPAVTRYLGGSVNEAAVDAALDRIAASQVKDGFTFWAVERRGDAAFLGYCGLKRMYDLGPPLDGEIEIGWRLREDAWGQGFAREAALACVDWAWANTALAHVHAITTPGNARSWGLMERLGMSRMWDGDFDHPKLAAGDPLRRHVTYTIKRPATP